MAAQSQDWFPESKSRARQGKGLVQDTLPGKASKVPLATIRMRGFVSVLPKAHQPWPWGRPLPSSPGCRRRVPAKSHCSGGSEGPSGVGQ